MITLEQIQKLDAQVKKAVSRIEELKTENNGLKKKLDDYQKRIEELEILISDFKRDQGEIEQGIINALSQLEKLDAEGGDGPGGATLGYDDSSEEPEQQEGAATGFDLSGGAPQEDPGRQSPDQESSEEEPAAEDESEEEPPDSTSELDIF
jgi:FtsZ-binding cell division protein ZapB